MFDNPEIKKLRQDIDLISEMIERLLEASETRHDDLMNKLEMLEEKVNDKGNEIATAVEDAKYEIEQGIEESKEE